MTSNFQTVCVIPARGGSRGVPRKNLRSVAGLPLVARAVGQARRAETVQRVVVSTEDPEIAEVARRHGADVVERPPELAGGSATSESALLHALDALEEEGRLPELLVFVQCTAPLLTAADIDGTVRALLDDEADCALAVAPSHRFLWRRDPDGTPRGVNHDPAERLRRQDREPELVETGSVYVVRVPGFLEARHRFFGRIALHVVPPERDLEVDDPHDLVRAEASLRLIEREDRVGLLPERPEALVLDFDGVFTDNTVSVDQDGVESVRCHRGDGMGIERLRRAGLPVVVLSREENPVVAARCRKLEVPFRHGIRDKLSALTEWLEEAGVDPLRTVFMGNDVNDAGCLEAVGCGVVPADAHPDVMALARIRLETSGGRGAVRELTDLIETRLRTP